jgi:hypothetical protein
MVQGQPHSAQALALWPLTRVRGQIPVLENGRLCAPAFQGLVVTVNPLQCRMSDSPHQSVDCPTTAWREASLAVLKHPHCGHSPASVVKYLCSDRGGASLLASPQGLVVTVKPLQCRMSDSPHQSGDCPTTKWCRASLTVLKHPHCGHSRRSVVKYPCSKAGVSVRERSRGSS